MENLTNPIQNSFNSPFSNKGKGGSTNEPKKRGSVTDEQWNKFMKIYNMGKKYGDPYPQLLAAQWALESGWGKKPSGLNNVFGVKARKNEKGSLTSTHEDLENGKVSIVDRFKDYDSEDEAVIDRIKRFSSIYKEAGTLNEAINLLHKSSYATSKTYDKALSDILKYNASMDLNNTTAFINEKPFPNSSSFNNKQLDSEIINNVNHVKDNIPTNSVLKTSPSNLVRDYKPTNLVRDYKPTNLVRENVNNNVLDINNNIDQLEETNPKAFGGNILSPIKDDNLNEFNAGGLHETNPYGGIPQGMGSNGKMNTVEEGETSYDIDGNKFIFSNRIII